MFQWVILSVFITSHLGGWWGTESKIVSQLSSVITVRSQCIICSLKRKILQIKVRNSTVTRISHPIAHAWKTWNKHYSTNLQLCVMGIWLWILCCFFPSSCYLLKLCYELYPRPKRWWAFLLLRFKAVLAAVAIIQEWGNFFSLRATFHHGQPWREHMTVVGEARTKRGQSCRLYCRLHSTHMVWPKTFCCLRQMTRWRYKSQPKWQLKFTSKLATGYIPSKCPDFSGMSPEFLKPSQLLTWSQKVPISPASGPLEAAGSSSWGGNGIVKEVWSDSRWWQQSWN